MKIRAVSAFSRPCGLLQENISMGDILQWQFVTAFFKIKLKSNLLAAF
jgi:hypothetical protein